MTERAIAGVANIERLDHLGIVAGIIKELDLVNLIDRRLGSDTRMKITHGEAVAVMIINGLGFSDRPLTLVPQFFENKALGQLLRSGVSPQELNRFRLGRTLDACHKYGCDLLFSEVALKVCASEKISDTFNSLDTTSISLSGEYNVKTNDRTIKVKHGYSKDHRSDLKQIIVELICVHDGGVPIASKSHDGNASDSKVFRERAKAIITGLKAGEGPRHLVADSKLYDSETAEQCLKFIPFITRIPASIKEESTVIHESIASPKAWIRANKKVRYQVHNVRHYGIDQRWIVVKTTDAKARATKQIRKRVAAEKQSLKKQLKKLSCEHFACETDAREALEKLKSKYHSITCSQVHEVKEYLKKGRPKPETPFNVRYTVEGKMLANKDVIKKCIEKSSCIVVATSANSKDLPDAKVFQVYKNQNNSVEKGFRFMKDPLMFTSSLFLKLPHRIEGLVMVMSLALLVYGIAQRRLRRSLEKTQSTLPNQINKETRTPTLRWVFQIMEGVETVTLRIKRTTRTIVCGLTVLKKRIISCFGKEVIKIYKPIVGPARAGP